MRPLSAGPVLPLRIFLFAAPFLSGLFYEPLSAAASLFLLAYLCITAFRCGRLSVPKTPLFFAVLVYVLMYAVSFLWAADRGMAMTGFVKFLPLPLFVIACSQVSCEERNRLIDDLPVSGAAMVLISAPLSYHPSFIAYLQMSNRLGGFFQYPNTFACFLLAGLIVLLTREKWTVKEWVLTVLLGAGILMSGSRTVMILTAVMFVTVLALRIHVRRNLAVGGAALAGGFLLLWATGTAGHLLRQITALAGGNTDLSTFYARLLYAADALPVILKHPLGTGYLGWYFLQHSVQTGAYSAMHLHNDFLQIIMDTGWLPGILFAWVAVRALVRKEYAVRQKLIAVFMVLHLLLDYDLQFVVMDLVLLLALMPSAEEKSGTSSVKPAVLSAICAILALISIYFGAAQALYEIHRPGAAVSVYPGHTLARTELLTQAETPEEMELQADRILKLDPHIGLAYNAKARAAFSRGDLGTMIREKQQAIAHAKYDLSTYLDYLDMLYIGIGLYQKAGDQNSAAFCRQCALDVPGMLEKVLEETSALGWKIDEKPQLELPEEYRTLIAEIKNMEE